MDAKGLIILLIIVTALSGIVLYWYNIQMTKSIPVFTSVPHNQATSLGATIFTKGSNPVSGKVPDTNPVSTTNPFDNYTNPFSQ